MAAIVRTAALLSVLVATALSRPARAEPGHEGPVLGGGAFVTGEGLGFDAVAGWARGRIAVALWARIAIDILAEESDGQRAIGLAVRGWSSAVERFYLEARAGRNTETVADFEGDDHRDAGPILGLAAGLELARSPRFTFDVRAGADYTSLFENSGVLWWGGLSVNFY